MSAVATREPSVRGTQGDSVEAPAQRLFEPKGPTLEDSILDIWRDLATADHATCPVCSGEMSRPGSCKRCGSELA